MNAGGLVRHAEERDNELFIQHKVINKYLLDITVSKRFTAYLHFQSLLIENKLEKSGSLGRDCNQTGTKLNFFVEWPQIQTRPLLRS